MERRRKIRPGCRENSLKFNRRFLTLTVKVAKVGRLFLRGRPTAGGAAERIKTFDRCSHGFELCVERSCDASFQLGQRKRSLRGRRREIEVLLVFKKVQYLLCLSKAIL